MKTAKIALTAGIAGSLLLASSAEAVITGLTAVPVSFEQGWLEADGSAAVNTSTPTTDLALHASVQAAWAASAGAYITCRVYITVDDQGTNVNGLAGDDVNMLDFTIQTFQDDGLTVPGSGFFNYQTGAIGSGEGASSAGPQTRSATNNAQGQRAYDSYLTVGGADQSSNSGAPIEGAPGDWFDAVRGRVGAANTVQTGGLGNGFSAATGIDCQNCGYLAITAVNAVEYSYNSVASLAANGGAPITGLGVLVGQFTIAADEIVWGSVLTVGQGTTQDENFVFSFQHAIPAPGALALLGLAGVTARRRRRS